MRRRSITPFLAALALVCGCGDDPSGPVTPPTPSILTVEFTGDSVSLFGSGAALRIGPGRPSVDEREPSGPKAECQVTAEWSACPDAGFASYTLYRSTVPAIEADPSQAEVLCSYTDPGQLVFVDESAGWATHYYYAVRISNGSGGVSWSNEAGIVTPGTPTPSVLSVEADGISAVLAWTQCPDTTFSCYSLYRSYVPGIAGDPPSGQLLGVFSDASTVSFCDSTQVEQTAYYALRTTSTLGFSAWSNEATAVLGDSAVIAWGSNGYGQCDVPWPDMGFANLAAGSSHTLGLLGDGSIVAWGDDTFGQCDIPGPNSGFVQVSAGSGLSLGLKASGEILAWGVDGSGQCEVPEPNSGFVAVAAGGLHSLGLKEDGTIVAWGNDIYGQCGVPEPNSEFVAIAAGYQHSLGIKSDGSIVAWGRNNWGQCDVPEPNTGFVAAAAGADHSLGLRDDGSIVAWGRNNWGQCAVPAPNSGFAAISAGYYHCLGLKEDGSIVAWGQNSDGECAVPWPDQNYEAVAAGGYHSCAIKVRFR
jgi:hypothetical protein